MKRISKENITELLDNQVFVVGTNELGTQGAGAAKYAFHNFGLPFYKGFGYSENSKGKTFAIPTKDWLVLTLSIDKIEFYVNRFIEFAKFSTLEFHVTAIGTGLAGYSVEDIAPLFRKCITLDNVYLPQTFIDYYENNPVSYTQS